MGTHKDDENISIGDAGFEADSIGRNFCSEVFHYLREVATGDRLSYESRPNILQIFECGTDENFVTTNAGSSVLDLSHSREQL